MKHVQVVAYCDGTHEDKVRSMIERTVSVDSSKAVVLDLCEPCDKIFQDLQALMERGAVAEQQSKGTKKSSTKRKVGVELTTTCPNCGYHTPSRSALGAHLKSHHDQKLTDFTDDQMDAAERAYKDSLVSA